MRRRDRNGSQPARRHSTGRCHPGRALVAVGGLLAALLAVAVPPPAGASTTIAVTSEADSGPGSFRAAIAEAEDADAPVVLEFDPHLWITLEDHVTYDGTEDLTVVGNGSTLLTDVDATFAGEAIFEVTAAGHTTIEALTVAPASGGGDARAVLVATGDLVVRDSVFASNRVATGLFHGGGGAIRGHGDVTISRSVFTGNRDAGAYSGGAVYASGDVDVSGSLFTDNEAADSGGAIWADGSLTVVESTFIGNSTDFASGAIGANILVEVDASTFSQNHAEAFGGALTSDDAATITNSTFVGNTVGSTGGATIQAGDELTLTHATIGGNSSPQVQLEFGSFSSSASVLFDPQPVDAGPALNCDVPSTTSDHSYATDDSCGFEGDGDVEDAPDPALGPLTHNHGPTLTMAPAAGSPLVDAVPPASCDGAVRDQRFVQRPQGPACDIGAVERIAVSFTDVGGGHPFHDEISWLAGAGITAGYPDGSFGADLPVTRQAMAAFLHRLAGEPEPAADAPTFSDVPEGHTFHEAISWLAGAGIATGYVDGTFRPAEEVSRQATAAFLERFHGRHGAP